MQEQFSRPFRLVIRIPPLLIRRDVAVEEPCFIPLDTGVAAGKVRPPYPETFYFGPLQNDTCLERFEYLIVPSGPLV